MGIPSLNQYLRANSANGINEKSLSLLRGKRIVVDTSIYIYKYLVDELLIENFYLLITTLKQFDIVPLFVFDGKPPLEKQDEIRDRKKRKENAKKEYDELYLAFQREKSPRKKNVIKSNMDNLKRQFIKVTHTDINKVKNLMQSYGISYCDADGEADLLCAAIVNSNKAYACLSEDMDLFVYGCKRVLRYLSLMNSTVVQYDTCIILDDLNLKYKDFKQICIITGCDYVKRNKKTFNKTLELFQDYCSNGVTHETFYQWIINNTDYFDETVVFEKIEDLFDCKNCRQELINNIRIMNSYPNTPVLRTILQQHGFVFI